MFSHRVLRRRPNASEGFPSRGDRSDRHVSANAPRGARRPFRAVPAYVGGWIALAVAIVGAAAFAERPGTVAQLIRGTDLKKSPVEGAASAGRLPRGTVLTLTGQQKNGFVSVEVELSDGAVQGWVPREMLNRTVRESLPDDPAQAKRDDVEADDEPIEDSPPRRADENDEEEVRDRPRSRVKVPKDEGVLLRRDDSFFYGVFGGGGVSFLENATTASIFPGAGFHVGGYAGYIFSSSFALQGEFGYANFNGDDPEGKIETLTFGFFSAEATAVYAIDRFELHGGLGYYYGLSLSASAGQVNGINTAGDLSTLTFHAGGAFRFPLTDVVSLGVAGRYMRGFLSSPVGISMAKAMVFLQFRG